MGSIAEILSTKVTTKAVSRVAAATSRILTLFQMNPGGANERSQGYRRFGYDIFNDARSVAIARAPGATSGTVRRQAVGRVDGTFPRVAEKLPLLLEELHNFRRIGGQMAEFDNGGQEFIRRQQRFMGQRVANFRLLSLGGMMRGKMYAHRTDSGDDIYYDFTSSSALHTVDWQIPAGNLSQLDMLGAGSIIGTSWDNPVADIPGDLLQIDKAFQVLCGSRLEFAVCGSTMWNNIINNDYVISQAGTSNTAFEIIQREDGVSENGMPRTTMLGRLRAVPWLTWHITNEGLDVGTQASTTYTPFVGDNNVWFGPQPNPDYMEMLLGSEPVSEGPNLPATERFGMHAYNVNTYDPAGYVLHTLDNALPALYVPKATAYGTCVF